MKTNTLCAILFVAIVLLLNGCRQQTATQLAAQQGEWVEITDTTHLLKIRGLSGHTYQTWQFFTGLTVRDTSEFLALATMIDTTEFWDREYYRKAPIILPEPPDFSKFSMLGFNYEYNSMDTLRLSFFVNDTQQLYRYSVRNISNPNIPKTMIRVASQNWLLVPKLK